MKALLSVFAIAALVVGSALLLAYAWPLLLATGAALFLMALSWSVVSSLRALVTCRCASEPMAQYPQGVPEVGDGDAFKQMLRERKARRESANAEIREMLAKYD